VLIPIPEATTRTAALLSGQVDWIEAPSPDAVPRLKSAGMQIITNVYPHIWSYHLSRLPDSPWNDIRVRKAANLAVDRAGLTQLLGGLMAAAKGHMPVGDPWFGRPSFDLKYDPAQAKALLAQAGYSPSRPVKAKILISASGSGQMQPLPMNEFIQQNFKDVGIEVEFVVMEWQSLLDQWRAGAKAPANPGGHAINVSYATQEPFSAFTRLVYGPLHAPDGVNWGWLSDPKLDDLLEKAKKSFDPEQRDRYLAEVHTYEVDNALFVWVAHDLNPRALSPKVKGFVQARNWFQDLTPVTVAQ
ncbi:MAG: ABC transporter substrate-binding protein, partial [bacterium]|nr:ABC transporter substrate-binding protein [bacterium]